MKIALNRVLILPDCRSRRELSGSGLKFENGALGVELWPNEGEIRISVPT